MTVFDWFAERGFIESVTSDALRDVLREPITFYFGVDPTAPSPHLGNWMGIIAAMQLENMGHRPVILVGGATGLIGDPSGKDKERPLLTREEVKENVQSLSAVFRRYLKNPIIVDNYDWFSKMDVISYLRDVGKEFRMGPMLARETVKNRIGSDEGMSYTEFSYALLQGYDFCYLAKHHGVQLQLGGSDQYGNIVSGIECTRRLIKKTVYGLTWPLLVRSDGKKFGKSEKGAIWLKRDLCSPFDLYQYLIRVPDADVGTLFRKLTLLDMEEIRALDKEERQQQRLAEEVTRLIHGEEGLEEARRATEALRPGTMQLQVEALDAAPGVTLPFLFRPCATALQTRG